VIKKFKPVDKIIGVIDAFFDKVSNRETYEYA